MRSQSDLAKLRCNSHFRAHTTERTPRSAHHGADPTERIPRSAFHGAHPTARTPHGPCS